MLGGVTRDAATGEITGAKAAQLLLIGKMNTTAARLEGINFDNALGEWVRISTEESDLALAWSDVFISSQWTISNVFI